MSSKTFIRRVMINSRTKQLSVTIPKKKLKADDPDVKFDKNLFVELRILKESEKHGKR